MTRIAAVLALMAVVMPIAYVIDQAVGTLRTLTVVERERDRWQRPDDVVRRLDLGPGDRVVDLGAGAGYFALKMAPRVAPHGRVLAIDLRRQSLAFLWIRAALGGHGNLDVIRGEADDPRLPPGLNDAVLMANTYHELTAPAPILRALFASLRSGGLMVVVDRAPRAATAPEVAAGHHEVTAAVAERDIGRQGFEAIVRHDRFIDRPGDDDIWWLIVFRKP